MRRPVPLKQQIFNSATQSRKVEQHREVLQRPEDGTMWSRSGTRKYRRWCFFFAKTIFFIFWMATVEKIFHFLAHQLLFCAFHAFLNRLTPTLQNGRLKKKSMSSAMGKTPKIQTAISPEILHPARSQPVPQPFERVLNTFCPGVRPTLVER